MVTKLFTSGIFGAVVEPMWIVGTSGIIDELTTAISASDTTWGCGVWSDIVEDDADDMVAATGWAPGAFGLEDRAMAMVPPAGITVIIKARTVIRILPFFLVLIAGLRWSGAIKRIVETAILPMIS
jgi:hypothetical protein